MFVQHPKEVTPAAGYGVPLIAVSRFLFDQLQSCGVDRLYLVPNGVDPTVFRPITRIEDRGPVIGMTYVPKSWKDPWTGLEALSRVKHVKPECRIILFGPTRQRAKIDFQITFHSRVPALQMPDIYNQCSIFVSSSRSEGFCLPILEAMACGCAVVATDSGGLRDFAVHGETAFVVPPGDAQAIAEAVLCLLEESDRRLKLARKGLEMAQKMNWDDSVTRLEHVLHEIGERK